MPSGTAKKVFECIGPPDSPEQVSVPAESSHADGRNRLRVGESHTDGITVR